MQLIHILELIQMFARENEESYEVSPLKNEKVLKSDFSSSYYLIDFISGQILNSCCVLSFINFCKHSISKSYHVLCASFRLKPINSTTASGSLGQLHLTTKIYIGFCLLQNNFHEIVENKINEEYLTHFECN